ncbi:MAG: SURF1 family protein [Gemmatimonadetes bacterium]|nr:SURF1 family protein [Gemmatimonadota bacterium]
MRRYAIFVVSIPVAAICARLGFWQLSRLQERRALNATLEANQALARLDVAESPGALPPFRPVTARGGWDYGRQIVVQGRAFEGVPAVVVVTPLVLADGYAALVERGWVPSPDARRVDLAVLAEEDSARVEGAVIPLGAPSVGGREPPAEWPKYVRQADPVVLAPLYPYPLLPYVVRRTNPAAPGPVARLLRPVPIPEPSNGPHLAYAIQWFAFAIIAMVGSVALFRREKGNGKRDA